MVMEFFIRKNSTLPLLQVNITKNLRVDSSTDNLDDSVIYFYMKDVETDVFKIAKEDAYYEAGSITYQFTKKNTSKIGRFEGYFKIENEEGLIDLPVGDKLYINIIDSFSNSEFCCK
jgi:hypothetical protein